LRALPKFLEANLQAEFSDLSLTKRLRQNVSKLFLYSNEIHLDLASDGILPDQIKSDINILRLVMMHTHPKCLGHLQFELLNFFTA
jgi:hypothetical protein